MLSSPIIGLLEFAIAFWLCGIVSGRFFVIKRGLRVGSTAWGRNCLLLGLLSFVFLVFVSLALLRIFPYFGYGTLLLYRLYVWSLGSFFLFIPFLSWSIRNGEFAGRLLLIPAACSLLFLVLLFSKQVFLLSRMSYSFQQLIVPIMALPLKILFFLFGLVAVGEFVVWLRYFASQKQWQRSKRVVQGTLFTLLFFTVCVGLAGFLLQRDFLTSYYEPVAYGVLIYSLLLAKKMGHSFIRVS